MATVGVKGYRSRHKVCRAHGRILRPTEWRPLFGQLIE